LGGKEWAEYRGNSTTRKGPPGAVYIREQMDGAIWQLALAIIKIFPLKK